MRGVFQNHFRLSINSLAMGEVGASNMWLLATILDTKDTDHFHLCRNFYWTALTGFRRI